MGVAIASVAAIWGIVGVMLHSARDDVLNNALTAASNVVETVTREESRNIEMLDLSLQALRDGVRDPDVMALPSKLKRAILFDRSAIASDIDALLFLDSDGRIVVDSDSEAPRRQRFGDKDFFRAHSHDSDRGLFVSNPFLSPFDDDWTLAISRRVDRPDGNFGGVVVGLVKLAYFDDLFSRLKLGPNDSMTLLRLDGTMIMRRPLDEHDLGRVITRAELLSRLKTASAGSYDAYSRFDGIHRIFRFQRVSALPLVQNVGLAVDDLYGPWRRKAVVTTAAMAALCTTILALVGFLQIQLRRRAQAEAAYAQLAATDKLTGMANRRRFDEVLEAEWRRSGRGDEALALLLVDVDHFKAYNDTYGHLGGDRVLAGLGASLQAALMRPGDFAARYGGEEFVVLLPNTDARGALKVAERLRTGVADRRQPHAAAAEGIVTVSVGVAAMVPRSGQPAADLMTVADLALYNAKNSGRNRTVLGQPEMRKFAA